MDYIYWHRHHVDRGGKIEHTKPYDDTSRYVVNIILHATVYFQDWLCVPFRLYGEQRIPVERIQSIHMPLQRNGIHRFGTKALPQLILYAIRELGHCHKNPITRATRIERFDMDVSH